MIVPIYNTEKYLAQCVDSILGQTYRNLEVILVDDGSTDGSPAMCDDYARKDERVKVLHKSNGGQSTARNMGLDAAHGEYIGFIDSDDSIRPEMYMRLYELLTENDADMSMCELYRFDETGKEVVLPSFSNEVITGDDILEHYVMPQYKGSYVNPVNKLYKSELWEHMRFKEGYIHEDTIIAHRILALCKKIVTSNEQLYLRLMRRDSTMGSTENRFQLNSFYGQMYAFTDLYNCLIEQGRPDLTEFIFMYSARPLNYMFKHVNYFQYKEELGDLPQRTLKKLLLSPHLGLKLRGIKLALMWFRSIFRPFIDKEKNL